MLNWWCIRWPVGFKRLIIWMKIWRYLSCDLCLKANNIPLFWLHYGLWPVRNETLFNFQWGPGVNQPVHEADHLRLSNVKVCVAVCSLYLYAIMICTGIILVEFQNDCVCAYCRFFLYVRRKDGCRLECWWDAWLERGSNKGAATPSCFAWYILWIEFESSQYGDLKK